MSEPAAIPEFTTRPKTDTDGAAEDPEDVFRFRLDGVVLTARRPKDALVAQVAPIGSRRTPGLQKIKLALDFLGDCLDPESRGYIEGRLLDPADTFDVDDAMPILEAIGDHWKGRRPAGRR